METKESISIVLHLKVKASTLQWTLFGNDRLVIGPEETPHNLNELEKNTINLLVNLQRSLIDWVVENNSLPEDLRKVITEKTFDVVEVLGDHLYQVLFPEPVLARMRKAREDLTPGQLLRIELEFEEDAVAAWPWEYLRSPESGGRFLALDTELVLTRALTFPTQSYRKLKTSQPVTVLLVVARPRDLGPVVMEPLYQNICALSRANVIRLHELIEPEPGEFLDPDYRPVASKAAFEAKIDELVRKSGTEDEQPAIIHFIGHGHREGRGKASRGQLAFVGKDGKKDWMDDKDFADLVAKSRNLKLVFLQACESGMPDPQASVSGVALQVASKLIPAIVAMQARVENDVAIQFACQFYDTLKTGLPIDLAVKEGLKAIKDIGDKQKLAFAVPVLYLRSNDAGSLIDQAVQTSSQPTNLVTSSRMPEATGQLTESCPRCGEIKRRLNLPFCTNCGLGFYCNKCKGRLDNPMGKRCGECSEIITQLEWPEPVSKPQAGG
jgi:hypothetical protein